MGFGTPGPVGAGSGAGPDVDCGWDCAVAECVTGVVVAGW